MAGIQEIAAATGLSKSTVSRALRGLPSVAPETERAVRREAERLNYAPSSAAASLATGRNLAVGVLAPGVERWFCAAAIEGIDSELRAAGYDLLLARVDTGRSESMALLRMFRGKRVDGLLVVDQDLDDDKRRQIRIAQYPCIGVGGAPADVPTVTIDDYRAGQAAVKVLVNQGHRRIALIRQDDAAGRSRAPMLRERGFMDAVDVSGAVWRHAWRYLGRCTVEGGYEAGMRLLRDADPPTAVVVLSDQMAIGVIQAARALGVAVPDALSVIGVDGHCDGGVFGLTTLAQDPWQQGAEAARALVAELQGGAPAVSFPPAPTRLLMRATVSAAPKVGGAVKPSATDWDLHAAADEP